MDKNKAYYNTAFDIFSFFNEKEKVTDFLEFLFSESIKISKKIEENGNKVPYPIQFEHRGFAYQIDYQFFIYILAKYVAKQTHDKGKIKSVLRAFGLFRTTITKQTYQEYRRLLTFFFEQNLKIITINSIDKVKNKFSFMWYNSFVPKVIMHNEIYYEYKTITFFKHGMRHYFEDWDDFMRKNDDYFFQHDVEQVAFSNTKVDEFWKKLKLGNKQKKRFYFGITDSDLLDDLDNLENKILGLK